MFKIIQSNSVFKLKEVDAEGNSVRLLPQEFKTEEDAKSFMESQDQTQSDTPVAQTPPSESIPATETAPQSEDASPSNAAEQTAQ